MILAFATGQQFSQGGALRTISGTYYDTIIASVGCDTLKTTNLIVRTTTTGILNQSICTGQSYLFNGVNRTSTGTYLDTSINFAGCDSIITLNLSVNSFSTGSINRNICRGQSYLFNGINRTTTGIYLDTLPISLGCDSILSLSLTVIPTSASTIDISLCNGQSYFFNGINQSSAGTFLDTFPNFAGCDSIVTLNLTVRPTSSSTINTSICSGNTYFFNGVNRSTTGSFLDTLLNYTSCDSIITLNLIVKPISSFSQNISICEGNTYVIAGSSYAVSGNYFDTLTNIFACDSTINTRLTVIPANYSRNISICNGQSLILGGIARTTSGTYYDSLISFAGCDSIMQTILTANRTDSTSASVSICLGDAYSGIYYTNDTAFTLLRTNIFGCDSIIMLNINVNNLPVVSAGSDTTINLGQSAMLSANGASSFVWSNGVLLALNLVTPSVTSTYYVTGTDINNCKNIDTVTVFISTIIDTNLIAIPNAFSPNSDGINDVFKILGTQNLSIDAFQIFNRWGSLIFETKDINVGWDGNFNSREQPIGSYVYYIESHSKIDSKIKSYTGTVTLLR